ncbi:CBS domain-containing protein [Sphingomonas jaspsi]|uniref:CBS domain-containing protein n=1 Tax=Sphingomonas jaspsi TaxID=392409 RepID=UPI0004AC92B2|nr:CBS domain-containing protein [Sphingomonas jaspsi]
MTIATIIGSKGGEVSYVHAGARVRDSLLLLAEKRIGAVPVIDGDRIAGIFSERDLVGCLASHGAEALDWPVDRVMSSPAITVESSTPILSALSTMTNRRIRHLPVVDGGEIRGIVSIGDLVKHRIEQIEAEAEAMLSYIQSV